MIKSFLKNITKNRFSTLEIVCAVLISTSPIEFWIKISLLIFVVIANHILEMGANS